MNTTWFQLTPSVTASFAELILALVLLGYLLSLKNKSKDTRRFVLFLLVSILNFCGELLYNMAASPDMYRYTDWMQMGTLTLTFFFILWFAYVLVEDTYPRERSVFVTIGFFMLSASVYFYIVTSGKERYSAFLMLMLLCAWIAAVFFRKASKYKHRGAIRERKLFFSFAIWSLIQAIIFMVVNLIFFGHFIGFLFPRNLFPYLQHPLLMISQVYCCFIYFNYASESTSFQAKLVGVVLCAMLILLGLAPFVLAGMVQNLPNHEAFVQRMLLGVSILIPLTALLVVLGLPWFFRYGLLQPLGQVIKGVQRVNAGDLSAEVQFEINDEVGQLALHFNQMTTSLRQYANNMENLVATRTTELSSSLETLKSTQAQLIQSEKLASLGELTAGIAHEIQNPLNFVNNFAEVSAEMLDEMHEELGKGDTTEAIAIATDLKTNLKKINHHGQRASAIVKGMLEHSRASTGVKAPTDLNALTDEYLRLAYHGLRAKDSSFNATLETHFDPNLPKVSVIPQDIGRVLLNLINNAFYAVQQRASVGVTQSHADTMFQPTITVSTQKIGNQILIKVKDNGLGIPESIRDKIFQPFFTTKPTGQGTGLGLSLAYDIVTKGHGGTLDVDSTEGSGTVFTLRLPQN